LLDIMAHGGHGRVFIYNPARVGLYLRIGT
jgi:hypothetical protein